MYVATGPVFRKVGETKDVTWILPTADTRRAPVPNYYWKVLLKVKRDASGAVTSASSIGFWMEHKAYDNNTYANYAVCVNDIESWTGLDLFANLPGSIEESVESNSNWQTFQNF